jgi:hypothetical protein
MNTVEPSEIGLNPQCFYEIYLANIDGEENSQNE